MTPGRELWVPTSQARSDRLDGGSRALRASPPCSPRRLDDLEHLELARLLQVGVGVETTRLGGGLEPCPVSMITCSSGRNCLISRSTSSPCPRHLPVEDHDIDLGVGAYDLQRLLAARQVGCRSPASQPSASEVRKRSSSSTRRTLACCSSSLPRESALVACCRRGLAQPRIASPPRRRDRPAAAARRRPPSREQGQGLADDDLVEGRAEHPRRRSPPPAASRPRPEARARWQTPRGCRTTGTCGPSSSDQLGLSPTRETS